MKNEKQNYKLVNTSKLKRAALKTSLGFIISILTVVSILYSLYALDNWFGRNTVKFQSPIKFQQPIWVEKRPAPIQLLPINEVKAKELGTAIQRANFLPPKGYASMNSIETAICDTFGKHCANALKIAQCESGMDTQKVGDLGISYKKKGTQYGLSFGIFQIRYLEGRPKPSELLKPEVNIQYAAKLFRSLGSFGSTAGWYNCAKKLGIK